MDTYNKHASIFVIEIYKTFLGGSLNFVKPYYQKVCKIQQTNMKPTNLAEN